MEWCPQHELNEPIYSLQMVIILNPRSADDLCHDRGGSILLLETSSEEIDFMGLFPSSFRNQYLLLAVDYVFKWVEALPTNDTKAVVRFLRKNSFSIFGTPRALVSDERSDICSKQFEAVLAKYSVRHRMRTTYHPLANGQAEEIRIDEYLQQLQPYTFIQEQGFDPLMRNCKSVGEIATEREWTNFCLPLEEPTFYDAPYYYYDYLYKTSLKEFKNVDMEEIFRFVTEGKEVWTYQPGTTIPKMFNQALMTPKAKIWMKFVCPRIWPTYDLVDISLIQAILVSVIL
ncbi:hypothetical protein Gotri_012490 [Gossypium trilobum]|uniref:Integrase catalytic domain-containing protein n=1 Tax=Gossypium trilobum TaxID=34281 RepID=A0A7J9DQN0_9ROSI|nr:hypothetical protein [Gossypium trilobum]